LIPNPPPSGISLYQKETVAYQANILDFIENTMKSSFLAEEECQGARS